MMRKGHPPKPYSKQFMPQFLPFPRLIPSSSNAFLFKLVFKIPVSKIPFSTKAQSILTFPLVLLMVGFQTLATNAQSRVYSPIPLTPGKNISDKLSNQDIPTGQGGFARDYIVQLEAGSQLTIDLTSNNFDTLVYLITSEGTTVAENDDGPDGTSNSLLFARITKSGTYYIRVRSFGEVANGNFTLKVTLLKAQS
jgi:hypothetical protein